MNWNPIIAWPTPSVYDYVGLKREPLHEAYTVYGNTRVSCCFCIMSSAADLTASVSCPDNADIYRRMVHLEIVSTFALQGAKWLGDVAPHLLSAEDRDALADAKERAAMRVRAEARVPRHLLFSAGWPSAVLTQEEAELLAEVRREVAAILGLAIGYTSASEVQERYKALIELRRSKRTS